MDASNLPSFDAASQQQQQTLLMHLATQHPSSSLSPLPPPSLAAATSLLPPSTTTTTTTTTVIAATPKVPASARGPSFFSPSSALVGGVDMSGSVLLGVGGGGGGAALSPQVNYFDSTLRRMDADSARGVGGIGDEDHRRSLIYSSVSPMAPLLEVGIAITGVRGDGTGALLNEAPLSPARNSTAGALRDGPPPVATTPTSAVCGEGPSGDSAPCSLPPAPNVVAPATDVSPGVAAGAVQLLPDPCMDESTSFAIYTASLVLSGGGGGGHAPADGLDPADGDAVANPLMTCGNPQGVVVDACPPSLTPQALPTALGVTVSSSSALFFGGFHGPTPSRNLVFSPTSVPHPSALVASASEGASGSVVASGVGGSPMTPQAEVLVRAHVTCTPPAATVAVAVAPTVPVAVADVGVVVPFEGNSPLPCTEDVRSPIASRGSSSRSPFKLGQPATSMHCRRGRDDHGVVSVPAPVLMLGGGEEVRSEPTTTASLLHRVVGGTAAVKKRGDPAWRRDAAVVSARLAEAMEELSQKATALCAQQEVDNAVKALRAAARADALRCKEAVVKARQTVEGLGMPMGGAATNSLLAPNTGRIPPPSASGRGPLPPPPSSFSLPSSLKEAGDGLLCAFGRTAAQVGLRLNAVTAATGRTAATARALAAEQRTVSDAFGDLLRGIEHAEAQRFATAVRVLEDEMGIAKAFADLKLAAEAAALTATCHSNGVEGERARGACDDAVDAHHTEHGTHHVAEVMGARDDGLVDDATAPASGGDPADSGPDTPNADANAAPAIAIPTRMFLSSYFHNDEQALLHALREWSVGYGGYGAEAPTHRPLEAVLRGHADVRRAYYAQVGILSRRTLEMGSSPNAGASTAAGAAMGGAAVVPSPTTTADPFTLRTKELPRLAAKVARARREKVRHAQGNYHHQALEHMF